MSRNFTPLTRLATLAELYAARHARRARNNRLACVAVLCIGALVPFLFFYL